VKPEDAEHADEKGGHDQESPIKEGLLDRIFVSGVSDELDKTGIGSGVTLSTSFYEPLIRNQGLRVLGRQDAVKPVAVRAAGDDRGIAQLFNLSVIAFVVGLSGDEVDLIPFHHLPVAMALLADLGMKLLSKGHDFWFIAFQHRNLVKSVAVGTRGGIWIPCEDGFTMNALRITVIRMTGGACLDHPGLVPLPGCQFVDLLVTIDALDLVDEVGTGIMLRGLSLMTSVAGDGFRVDLRPLGL